MPGSGVFVRRLSGHVLCVACIVACSASCFAPGFVAAGPIVVSEVYDFRTDDGRSTGGAWTASHSGGGPAAERWRWTGSSQRGTGRWTESPARGRGHAERGNYLTSPVIDVKAMLGVSADSFRLSIAQRFNFTLNSIGRPLAAGEIAYSLDGGSFVAIPTGAFTSGGSIYDASFEGLESPFATTPGLVGRTAFVPPRGEWTGPPPLLSEGGIFTGRSPGYARGVFVPTEAILDFSDTGTTFDTIQFRFIEAGTGSRCPPKSRWDVRYVQADFIAPEPSGLVLAGLGCLTAALGWWRSHQRGLHLRSWPKGRPQAIAGSAESCPNSRPTGSATTSRIGSGTSSKSFRPDRSAGSNSGRSRAAPPAGSTTT